MLNTSNSFDPDLTRGLDIEGIIGAPIVATARANSMMAREQVQFLIDFCFFKKDEVYQPVMIQMSVRRSNVIPGEKPGDPPTIQQVEATLNVPLLTLIPINSLAIESLKIKFRLDITTQISQNENMGNQNGSATGNAQKIQLLGKLGGSSNEGGNKDTSNQRKSSSHLEVNIKAGPLPLPVGVTSMLEYLSKAMFSV
jgi:hypothetical protein